MSVTVQEKVLWDLADALGITIEFKDAKLRGSVKKRLLFGWVPVAGQLMKGAAILVSWLLATVGFGAALLSRGGLREQFAGRIIPQEMLTDEYLWATPRFGVPAAKRPDVEKRPGDR